MHHTDYPVMFLLFLFPLSPFVLRMCCPCAVTTLSFSFLFYFRSLILLELMLCMHFWLPYRTSQFLISISNREKPNIKAWRVLSPSWLQMSSNDRRQHCLCPFDNSPCSNFYMLCYRKVMQCEHCSCSMAGWDMAFHILLPESIYTAFPSTTRANSLKTSGRAYRLK